MICHDLDFFPLQTWPQTYLLSQRPSKREHHLWLFQVWSHQGRAVLPACDSVASDCMSSWDGNLITQATPRLSRLPKASAHCVIISCLLDCAMVPLILPKSQRTRLSDKEGMTTRNYTPEAFLSDQTS